MDLNLKDRVVVVTGANGGIGRAIAEVAVEEGAIVGRDQATCRETVEALGPDRSSYILCDVSRDEDARLMVEAAAGRYGRGATSGCAD